MKILRNCFLCVGLFNLIGITYPAPTIQAVSGYYLMSVNPADYSGWTTPSTLGCPGITFPSTIDLGQPPPLANEIIFNIANLTPPYTCTTLYQNGQKYCLFSIEYNVQNKILSDVQFTSMGNCSTMYDNPIVLLN